MTSGRSGIDAKFSRAICVLDDLEQRVAEFLSSDPFTLEALDEAVSGDLVYRVRVRSQPPLDWSVLVGDVVHNARSALDHLAHRLVECGGGIPTEATHFPISDQEAGYGEKVRKALKGAEMTSREAIKALKPWHGGDDRLWKLHRLDVIDKHRLLVPVGSAQRGISLGSVFRGFDGSGGDSVAIPCIELLTDDRQYPLQDGAEVFRIMKAARDADAADSSWKTEHAVTFEIAFGDGVVVDGEPLLRSLREMVSHAAVVVEFLVATVV